MIRKGILLQVATMILLISSCSISKNAIIQEPKKSNNDIYIKHYAYSLAFNEQTKQANWVSYKLNKYQTEKNFKRTNKFLVDTLITTGTATNADYYKSGYDKGHFAPASDMTWNSQAMRESFYFSNISPQLPRFNRGIWKKLEMNVRKWSAIYDSIYICTGPIFINSSKYIGNNKISVPTHFYKTILVYNDTIKQGIGFIFPNKASKTSIFDFAVTIDSVEQLTNLNLYSSIPNRIEKKIERKYHINYWKNKR